MSADKRVTIPREAVEEAAHDLYTLSASRDPETVLTHFLTRHGITVTDPPPQVGDVVTTTGQVKALLQWSLLRGVNDQHAYRADDDDDDDAPWVIQSDLWLPSAEVLDNLGGSATVVYVGPGSHEAGHAAAQEAQR